MLRDVSSVACFLLQELMRELDEKEEVIKFVQDNAETLLAENHPARLTIEVRGNLLISRLCSH